MITHHNTISQSGIYITFSGNCKKALIFYQHCFGGVMQYETFDEELPGYKSPLVVSGRLISDGIVIHGSDLVHNEGRIRGNYMSVYLHCNDHGNRRALIKKLAGKNYELFTYDHSQQLIEITDAFDVRWILAV